MRKSLAKKIRFDVFKRDLFECQYCGRMPPAVTLEVDHIHPVARHGKNDLDNLITSCFDCNRGKGAELLSSAPSTVAQKAAALAEKEDQIRAFNRLLGDKRRRENRQIAALNSIFEDALGYSFTPRFQESIRQNFIPYLTQDQLLMAINVAVSKLSDPARASAYFCGICWKLRRIENTHG